MHESQTWVSGGMLARLKQIVNGQDYVSQPRTICRWAGPYGSVLFHAPYQDHDRAPVMVSGMVPGDLACQIAALINGYYENDDHGM